MHYPAGRPSKHPLTVILRGHILSVREFQTRYVVRGTKGTYTKQGVDVQEDQLKVIPSPSAIFETKYGLEPEHLWGKLENLQSDQTSVSKTV